MSKAVKIRNTVIRFPPVCSLCLAPASSTYSLVESVNYGRRASAVKLAVPLCETHLAQAKHTGTRARLVEMLGLMAGMAAGGTAGGEIWALQTRSVQPDLWLNICLAVFVGLGAGGLVWGAIAMGLAPHFADAETKAARTAVRIRDALPNRAGLELVFVNETMADRVAKENAESVVE